MVANGDYSPTPSALMELREEREVVKEGYRFLDEKRLLLAAEIIRQLKRYRELEQAADRERQSAVQGLADAAERHGLEELWIYPPLSLQEAELEVTSRRFLGVVIQESELRAEKSTSRPALDPSPESGRCAQSFRAWLLTAAELAAIGGNLERLLEEYRKTARRARALEDVVLPELETALNEITSRLEELDQEEAIRGRLNSPK